MEKSKEQGQRWQSQFHMGITLDGSTTSMELKEMAHRMLPQMISLEKMDIYVEADFSAFSFVTELEELFYAIRATSCSSQSKLYSLRIIRSSSSYNPRWTGLPYSALQSLLLEEEGGKSGVSSLKRLCLSNVTFSKLTQQQAQAQHGHCNYCPLFDLVQLLESNSTIQELRLNYNNSGLFKYKIPRSTQQAFVNMLRYHNTTLTQIDMRTLQKFSSSQYRRDIQFYLYLNQQKCHPHTLQEAQDWVNAIVTNQERVDVVHFLLLHNPEMLLSSSL